MRERLISNLVEGARSPCSSSSCRAFLNNIITVRNCRLSENCVMILRHLVCSSADCMSQFTPFKKLNLKSYVLHLFMQLKCVLFKITWWQIHRTHDFNSRIEWDILAFYFMDFIIRSVVLRLMIIAAREVNFFQHYIQVAYKIEVRNVAVKFNLLKEYWLI